MNPYLPALPPIAALILDGFRVSAFEIRNSFWFRDSVPGIKSLMFVGKVIGTIFLFLVLAAHGLGAILTVTTDGAGTVSPNLNGEDLQVGKAYTLTAKPAAGYLFASWTGSRSSKQASLNFAMEENMTLQANFVPNPFIARKGSYAGLYAVTSAPPGTVAGGFAITVTDRGSFSGSLQFQGKKVAFSGQFNLSGTAAGIVLLAPDSPAILSFDLLGTPGVTGTITNGQAVAEIRANRAGFDRTRPSPQAGRYTMIIPGSPGAGDGYAAVTVDSIGKVKAVGKLADGAAFTQSASLASDGSWPLFLSLYQGTGLAWGWLSFTNREQSDFDGLLTWVKPGQPPLVITNNVRGSRYTAPPGRVLDFAEGLVTLSGGGLPGPYSAAMTLTANNTIIDNIAINGSGIRLQMQIKTATGTFTGSLTPPALLRLTKFEGAVFQKGNSGFGFFLNGSASGRVTISESVNE
jgi:hypothetical protein